MSLFELFAELTRGGEVIDVPGYPGTMVRLADGGTVGLRLVLGSGDPAIDVNIAGFQNLVTKIHFGP